MPRLERTTIVPASIGEVFPFFSNPANLARITPPSLGFRIVEIPEGPLHSGSIIRYSVRPFFVPLGWTSRIDEWVEGRSFVDSQLSGPYARWVHRHQLRSVTAGVEMRDTVDYELPLGWLGALVAGWFVKRQLRRIFDYREKVIREIFGGQR